MPTVLDRLGYVARQTARVAWYSGHYWAGRRLLQPLPRPAAAAGPMPDRAALLEEMRALFARDWQNIAAGLYAAPPADDAALPHRALADSLRYFRDLPAVDRRRHAKAGREVAADPAHAHLPPYYRQNFHFQSDGWLSPQSAALYDIQVEVLFTGSADAMRRQGLVPIAGFLQGRDSRGLRLLDIGCGTGRFLSFVHASWPGLRLVGLDLSPPYLARARRTVGDSRRVQLVEAPGEALPFADASFELVSAVFLLHELPRKVRASLAREAARVLVPGGRLIIVDSLQKSDRPDWAGLLDLFPHHFHEPYYADYAESDLAALFAEAGLRLCTSQPAFLSKVVTFEKPVTRS